MAKPRKTITPEAAPDDLPRVRYRLLACVGGGRSRWRTGSVAELLRAIPYLLIHDILPHVRPLNELLRGGMKHAGMSGGADWKPFELSEGQYNLLLAELRKGNKRMQTLPTPAWVKTHLDWHAHLFEHLTGAPAKRHRALLKKEGELSRVLHSPEVWNDPSKRDPLFAKWIKAADATSEFMRPYLWKNRPR